MTFISWHYLCFIAIVWLVFYFTQAQKRMLVLLAASYIFYAYWSVPFLALILLTTSVDYFCARRISASTDDKLRKTLLWLGITLNLLVLCSFKYMNLILASQHSLLAFFGINTPNLHLDIILPLGISFYTFEAISYLVDVYRGAQSAPTWLTYNFYIMYFPHLVAGPIVRFNKLFPQYSDGIERPDLVRIKSGLELILLGLAFKLIFADGAALICAELFPKSAVLTSMEAMLVALAFGLQLYLDFQGYTHIARGTSLLFNIYLPVNFRFPLNSATIVDFWQRWNITLSQWLFDYVYKPLGGMRKSLSLRMRATFLTLLIAGIWHGAGLNYVLMGAYFGVLVACYHGYRSLTKHLPANIEQKRSGNPIYRFASWLLTLYLLLPAGVLFNPNLETDLSVIRRLLPSMKGLCEIQSALLHADYLARYLATLVLILLCGFAPPVIAKIYQRQFQTLPYWLRVQTATIVIVLCVIFESQQTDPAFIYAQF